MLNGQCPRCRSRSVYRSRNGVISGDKHIFVRGLGFSSPRSDRMTYVCTACGYYENYISDKAVCRKIASKWEKV